MRTCVLYAYDCVLILERHLCISFHVIDSSQLFQDIDSVWNHFRTKEKISIGLRQREQKRFYSGVYEF